MHDLSTVVLPLESRVTELCCAVESCCRQMHRAQEQSCRCCAAGGLGMRLMRGKRAWAGSSREFDEHRDWQARRVAI